MVSFDYITSKEFRESLETDNLSLPTKPPRTGKNPLSMDLGEAITVCHAEKAISDRTADLCSVIKSYRNLIHPGRMVRLKEPSPDKPSATVAVSLVEMIVDELAKVRRQAVGLTGEQILSKLLRDQNSLPILKHLLQETSEFQRERLLLELIPPAYESANKEWLDEDDTRPGRLKSAYRIILDNVTEQTRMKAAAEFVRVLREEDGSRVLIYGDAFFKPADLEFVLPQHVAMVREHLLNPVSGIQGHTLDSLDRIDGIGNYLVVADVVKFLDPFIKTFISSNVDKLTLRIKDKAREKLLALTLDTNAEVDAAIESRLDDWIKFLEQGNRPDDAELLRKLKNDVQRISF